MRPASNDSIIRPSRPDEHEHILAVVNAAADRYRGVIPDDCWHEPYMGRAELANDIARGVTFWVVDSASSDDGSLDGVMGIQPVKGVTLVRHAYVRPDCQGRGIGGRLLQHLETLADGPILIGTWAAATWAIRFYEAHGYALAPAHETPALLGAYWEITDRQAAASVVLSKRFPAPRR